MDPLDDAPLQGDAIWVGHLPEVHYYSLPLLNPHSLASTSQMIGMQMVDLDEEEERAGD
jgi:hypothetical protein